MAGGLDRSPVSRREFLKGAGGLGIALLGGLTARRAGAQPPPSERFGAALIGCGGMGRGHLGAMLGHPRLAVIAVCDVDANHLQEAVNQTRGQAKAYRDYREVLARDDIDIVCIATPDHWHATITVQACQAGKDVYVEKPMTHNIAEGRAMVEAARRYNRVVQLGTQQRAQGHFREAVELVRSGRIGEVKRARCWIGPGGGGSWGPDGPPPAELDWDFWLGPAPYVPYNPNRVHFVWRYFWDYGGGLMTDWGVHLIDIVHWALGEEIPKTIEARGTYPTGGYQDVPEEMVVEYEYPSYHLTWNQEHGQRWDPEGHGYGIMFYGSEGELFVDRSGYKTYPEERPIAPLGPGDFHLPRVRSHWDDFLNCVMTRDRPASDVEVGHHSTAACHLGNIAFRTGRLLRWDGQAERFIGDPDADRLLSRPPRAPYEL